MIDTKHPVDIESEFIPYSNQAAAILATWTQIALQESNPKYRDDALRIGRSFARILDSACIGLEG